MTTREAAIGSHHSADGVGRVSSSVREWARKELGLIGPTPPGRSTLSRCGCTAVGFTIVSPLVRPEWAQGTHSLFDQPRLCTQARSLSQVEGLANGSDVWLDPFSSPAPSREAAQGDLRAAAQRALQGWVDCAPAVYLPRSCQRCGHPTRNVCADCWAGCCQTCEAGAEARGFPGVCCLEMYGGESRHFPAPPLRVGKSDVEVFRAIMGLPPRS